MKRAALVLSAIFLIAGLMGCGSGEEIQEVAPEVGAPETPGPSFTPGPAITPQPRMPKAGQTPEPSEAPPGGEAASGEEEVLVELTISGNNPRVRVVDTVAHALSVEGETLLYGAVEYENNGDCDVIITDAALEFQWQGGSAQADYAPALGKYDVVEPGQTGYLVYYKARTDLTPGAGVSLTARLSCQKADRARLPMTVDHLTLVHNFPRFCTLTGTLTADFTGEYSLNMIYVAFYEEDGSLLGVWNFTRNALFHGGESKNFAVHLKSLPIEGLETRTARTKAVAYGF